MCDTDPMSENLAKDVGVLVGNPVTTTSSMSLSWRALSAATTP
jgi:hypothetical protein